jgi:hypothetical protein
VTIDDGGSRGGGDRPHDEQRLALDVEPLDELTRRRLVRAALDAANDQGSTAPARSRPGRWVAVGGALAAAAAAVIGLVVVTESRTPDDVTAARAPAAAAESAPGGATSDSSASRGQGSTALAAATRSLGDLGTLADAAELRRAINRADTRTENRSGAAPQKSEADGGHCAGTVADAGTPVATGSATWRGRAAEIVVVEQSSGTQIAFVLVPDSCERLDRVEL